MLLCGAARPEDIGEETLERYRHLSDHPVVINRCSRSKLLESGLFSPYQVAALLDYIAGTGDVLSYGELAVIDGFGREYAEALQHFVSFASGMEGKSPWREISSSAVVRVSGTASMNAGTRYEMRIGRNSGFWAGCSGFDRMASVTAGVCYGDRRGRFKVILGDFNARFGQGCGVWNTMTLSSLNSVASMLRRPGGLSATSSFAANYALTGAAASAEFGRHSLSLAGYVPGLKTALLNGINRSGKKASASLSPLLNYSYWGKRFTAGITAAADFPLGTGSDCRPSGKSPGISGAVVSADIRSCLSSLDLAAEVCARLPESQVSGVLAAAAPIGEHFKFGFRALYSPGTHSISSCLEFSDRRKMSATLSAEPAYKTGKGFQLKLFGKYMLSWREGASAGVQISFRYQDYAANPIRISIRHSVSVSYGSCWTSSARMETAFCGRLAALGYCEQSFAKSSGGRQDSVAAHLRLGAFLVDHWDSRIYVYERDVPGCFNVPAMYGRGLWAAGYVSWKYAAWGKLACRLAYRSYCLMPRASRRADMFEFRIQSSFSF